MKYQVWAVARDAKNLHPIADVLVFEDEIRTKAEQYNETFDVRGAAKFLFGQVVLGQNPIYSAETRIPGWGAMAGSAATVAGAEERRLVEIAKRAVTSGGVAVSGTQQRCRCAFPAPSTSTRCLNCGRPV